jgi:recombination protein RecA
MIPLKALSPKDPPRSKNILNETIAAIEKDFGKGSLMLMDGSSHLADIEVIPTGCLAIDIALGVGGMPRGRIVELFGAESSGKTTLALQIIAQAHAKGQTAAFIDAEHAMDPSYAQRLGVHLNKLLVSQPDCGEDALSIAEALIKSTVIDVVVVDSVAALVPRAELEGDIGDQHVGRQARLMSQALRRLTATIHKTSTTCIFINQIREKIGVMFGNPQTTPGGRALKFYSSVRLEIKRIGSIKGADEVVLGNRTRAIVVKNKVAPPFRKAEFDILYNEGISQAGSVLDLAVEKNILEKKGSWISYKGQHLGQGREQAIAELKKRSKVQEELIAEILKKEASPEVLPLAS